MLYNKLLVQPKSLRQIMQFLKISFNRGLGESHQTFNRKLLYHHKLKLTPLQRKDHMDLLTHKEQTRLVTIKTMVAMTLLNAGSLCLQHLANTLVGSPLMQEVLFQFISNLPDLALLQRDLLHLTNKLGLKFLEPPLSHPLKVLAIRILQPQLQAI